MSKQGCIYVYLRITVLIDIKCDDVNFFSHDLLLYNFLKIIFDTLELHTHSKNKISISFGPCSLINLYLFLTFLFLTEVYILSVFV